MNQNSGDRQVESLETKDNWGTIEYSLGGNPLSGEYEVRVEFPNGVETCKLIFRENDRYAYDHGNTYQVSEQIPYLVVNHLGLDVHIDLYPIREDIKLEIVD